MKTNTFISNYCVIKNDEIYLNGKKTFSAEGVPFSEFIKLSYKNYKIDYPKFFKMDNLSKLSFIAAEILIKGESNQDVALVFANNSSSLDTDIKYQNSISNKEEYFPSPAVFVYTLPNICIGEISIRHKLESENAFFVFDTFNAEFLSNYSSILIESGKAKKVLCGWVEYLNGNYNAALYLIEEEGSLKNNEQTINKIYNQ